MTTVAILAFPDVQSLDVVGPMDVFAEANRFLAPEAHYTLEVLGIEHGPLRCSNGITIPADKHFSEAHDAYDLLLVAGGTELVHREFDEGVCAWLRRAAALARYFGSIRSGAFILARAGLLDGKIATTHRGHAETLASLCRSARIEPDRLCVQDGRLHTSAGFTAGIDVSLRMLTQDKGNEVALNVAHSHMVCMLRAGGQTHFASYSEPNSPIAKVQEHVFSNLKGDLSVNALATVANMSVRNLFRVFVRDAKISPAEFVENARMEAARMMLESTTACLKKISYECGFNDTDRMRNLFRRRLGISAREYRESCKRPATVP